MSDVETADEAGCERERERALRALAGANPCLKALQVRCDAAPKRTVAGRGIKPYSEVEAALDALAGRRACPHRVWPHQGSCPECAVAIHWHARRTRQSVRDALAAAYGGAVKLSKQPRSAPPPVRRAGR